MAVDDVWAEPPGCAVSAGSLLFRSVGFGETARVRGPARALLVAVAGVPA